MRWALCGVALLGFAAAAAGIGVPATDGQHVAVDETQYVLTAISLAEDGDLDIADELAAQRWRAFADVEPPVQTAVRADGRAISPHDPLLPLLLALPVALGGWVGAKLALATVAGALAAATLWTAVRRFAVPPGLATAGVAIAAASAPLAVYGQQLYPELPAALVVVLAVAALPTPAARTPAARTLDPSCGSTGPVNSIKGPRCGAGRAVGRGVGVGVAVVALPWLSVKYVPVAAVLAGLGGYRWWRGGQRRATLVAAVLVAAAGAVYLAVHRVVWGGWTVYASGDHFVARGTEFAVVGDDVSLPGRALRLVALLTDRDYGLAAWQPAYLLAVAAVAVLAVRRPPNVAALLAPLGTGWLVATFVAATMHGFWWPGRHAVVVLPLAVLAVLTWLTSERRARGPALVLGLAGVVTYAGLLVTDGFGWVLGPDVATAPWQVLLPDYRGGFLLAHIAWCVVLIGLAGGAVVIARRGKVTVHPDR
ncbi:MAG: hypothetical protein ACT4RN_18255 [Pseudonocardia sp.]